MYKYNNRAQVASFKANTCDTTEHEDAFFISFDSAVQTLSRVQLQKSIICNGVLMEETHGNGSSYPKDLPWQELKAKVGVDESIFEKKGIIQDHAKEDSGPGSGSASSIHHPQSTDNPQSKLMDNEMMIKKPEKEPRPLPHQQVPQPDDFPTQALEQL
ncbi:hypothetical protein L2E82_19623 [Cichorium intybus]|uniref:Uncharacterized protein n=1 Tax=Cichorium intybus TaxID=13427 RepID=A0ACB9FBU5_CICIN|nr:hypothetical protein L2E82_19623 [Cichorium intybus]